MRYVSTRGGIGCVTFEEALFSGYADDGGLVVPETIPKVSLQTLSSWKTLSYPEIVQRVVQLFVTEDEIPEHELEKLISNAFERFDIDEVIKVVSFGDLHIAELWHGPTLAFKDLAMSCVGEFYNYFLSKRKKHVFILVGTSGDTGSSAIEAVRGKENIDIIVLLPHNRISKIQELMMTTVLDENVHVYAVDGFSDDFELTIKSAFADVEFSKQHNLCSINSINWGRVMVQIAHHVYMYLQVADTIGTVADIVIPTGGCGNVASAVFAQAMGLPVKLVSVVNENDIVHRTLQYNDFKVATEVVQTFACSMDIQIPANFERIIWIFSGQNSNLAKNIMIEFYKSGKADLPKELHKKITENLRSAVVTDNEITETLVKCWSENKYLPCPHSCASLAYYYGISKDGSRETSGSKLKDGSHAPMVCVSTASIDKFPEILEKAGIKPNEAPQGVRDLFGKATKFLLLKKDDDWEKILREKIVSISRPK